MTIASEIQRIANNIADCYTAAENKGATLPEEQNSDNLATCINSISTGSTINNEDISVTENGVYIHSDGYTGLGTVTVDVINKSGMHYSGDNTFTPTDTGVIDSTGISLSGGFCLDATPNCNQLGAGGQTGILNYLFKQDSQLGVRVRFKPNEINKVNKIIGNRTSNILTLSNTHSCFLILDKDNETITGGTSWYTVTGQLLSSATTTSYIDIMLLFFLDGYDWKMKLMQSTNLGQTWTAISSEVSGVSVIEYGPICLSFYDLSYGRGYINCYPFTFNGNIDTLHSGLYRIYDPAFSGIFQNSIYTEYLLCQPQSPALYIHRDPSSNFIIQNNIASGFSTTSMLLPVNPMYLEDGDSWERHTKITTGSDIQTEQWIFGATTDCMGFGLGIKDGKLLYFASSSNSSWDIESGGSGNNTLNNNTTYYIKTVCTYVDPNSYSYETYISTDNMNWILDRGVISSVHVTLQNTVIGMHADFNIPFLGSIDLLETYWTINGVEEWRAAYV